MPSFLGLFFPAVAAAQKSTVHKENSAFCTFNDFKLQLWTASMFLAGAFTGVTLHPPCCGAHGAAV